MEKEKPPIFGMIQRGGQVVIQMLENVQQVTIKPLIQSTIAPGTLIYTDEYAIYDRLEHNGVTHEKAFVTALVNMPAMRMAMGFMKFMSTRWRVFGRYCVLGCARIAEFLKPICRFI